MKWVYGVRYKLGVALWLTVIVTIILAGSFWERSLLTTLNSSFLSIYEDRLIPATELFHVNDIMYNKRLLLEKHLSGTSDEGKECIGTQLSLHNARIDSIITAFETTYLIDEESKGLKHFKEEVDKYNRLEQEYLQWEDKSFAIAYYEQNMIPIFLDVNESIVRLSNIQTEVGAQLLRGSVHDMGRASMVNYLQIAMVIIIALLVHVLLLTSRGMVPKKRQKFHLN